jgi:hypothetical protein
MGFGKNIFGMGREFADCELRVTSGGLFHAERRRRGGMRIGHRWGTDGILEQEGTEVTENSIGFSLLSPFDKLMA